ncbi:DUF6220 domain-containing protein [Paenibacillus sp.]|uniref:DUF6220 domain-containing protein n=1 Tax=Paenibacillus sp. TaxID=58172 RepID=UPI0028120EB1|nr:DUF6220 domain-containing protein [Paenibacillus sp.]
MQTQPNAAPVPEKGRGSRIAFAIFASVFAVCVGVQVLLAGLATFVDAVNWARHTSFIHFVEFIPLVMLALAFTGKLPARMRWQSFGLFFMIILMYFTANVVAVMPVVSAFHPVIALAIFALAQKLVPESWRLARV